MNLRKLGKNCVPRSHSLWVDSCHKTDLVKRHLAENMSLAGILGKGGWDFKARHVLSNLSWCVFMVIRGQQQHHTTSKRRCSLFGRTLIFFLQSHSQAFPVPIKISHIPCIWPSVSFWGKTIYSLVSCYNLLRKPSLKLLGIWIISRACGEGVKGNVTWKRYLVSNIRCDESSLLFRRAWNEKQRKKWIRKPVHSALLLSRSHE